VITNIIIIIIIIAIITTTTIVTVTIIVTIITIVTVTITIITTTIITTIIIITIMFSDKATCHLSGRTIEHNIRVWSRIILHAVIEGTRDSPKFSVFCILFQQNVLLLLDTQWLRYCI